ncbi:MAG: NAD-dependent epimerase/dehydratase family protein [Deinococcales bacterium]
MNILILGGTAFLGRHLVTAALEQNHTVTLFHRGNRNPYPKLENILGNRETDLERLAGHSWDAVIDTSAYVPRVASLSAKALENSVGRYCFISTISVYREFTKAHHENTPVATLEQQTEEVTGATYGALKVLCENTVQNVYQERALILRPGLIVGAHDPTDRFTYWVDRVAKGGKVLAPATAQTHVQFIDAFSLARFTIHALEQQLSGIYNLNGAPIQMGEVLSGIQRVSRSDAEFVWAPETFLEEQKIAPWMGENSLPLWIPGLDAATQGTIIQKALSAGLRFRALEETIQEVLEFAQTRRDHTWRSGLSAAREAELHTALAVKT